MLSLSRKAFQTQLDIPLDEKRKDHITRVGICLVVLGTPYLPLFLAFGFIEPAIAVIPCLILFSFSIFLNKKGFNNFAGLLLITTVSIAILYFGSVLGKESGAHTMYFAMVALPISFFKRKDFKNLCLGLAIPIASYFFLNWYGFNAITPIEIYAAYGVYIQLTISITVFSIIIGSIKLFSDMAVDSEVKLIKNNEELKSANKTLIEKAKIDKDIAAAARLQLQTIPTTFPQLPGIRIDHFYQPARNLGGDFIDGILLPDDRILILIGDIVGKGIQASLKMSMFYPLFRNFINNFQDLPTLVNDCNQFAHAFYEFTKHIPCLFAVIDAKNRTLTFINAGHEPGYVLRGSEMMKIDTPGFALGMEIEPSHEQGTIQLQKGDRVVFFTDGFTDIQNEDGSRFDEETLLEVMLDIDQGDHHTFIDILVDRLMTYKQTADQADDMAIVSIKIEESPC